MREPAAGCRTGCCCTMRKPLKQCHSRIGKEIREKLLKSSENILSQPSVKYNTLKALSGNGLDFDRDKFLEAAKESTDRSSFIYTPEEMKKMRKK